MSQPTTTTQPHASADAAPAPKVAPLYVDFLCYRLNPAFRRLDVAARQRGVDEFITMGRQHERALRIRPYLAIGLRADLDLVLWAIGPDVALFQSLVADLARTGLGSYLELTHAFLALRKASPYTKHHPQAFEADLPPRKYLFLYPFVKSREWYLTPFEQRRQMMKEHTDIGVKYPSVRINTTYAFGLGDQDFVLAFEADAPEDFEDLVQSLRESQASRYTVRDTPMIVAAFRSLEDTIQGLGV